MLEHSQVVRDRFRDDGVGVGGSAGADQRSLEEVGGLRSSDEGVGVVRDRFRDDGVGVGGSAGAAQRSLEEVEGLRSSDEGVGVGVGAAAAHKSRWDCVRP